MMYKKELFQMGISYYNDDNPLCFNIFVALANLGVVEAISMIGECYVDGIGVVEDVEKALFYYDKAISQGSYDAMYYKAQLYYIGIGVEIDYDKAFYLLTKAVDGGCEGAIYYLGECYMSGYGTPKNLDKAVLYFTMISDNDRALCMLGYIYGSTIYDNKNLDISFKCFEQSAYKNNVVAMYELALIYKYKKNYEEAVAWLDIASLNDFAKAQIKYAECFEKGLGVEKSRQKAIYWFSKAADSEDPEAMFIMHEVYLNEEGYINKEKALDYLNKAAVLKHPFGFFRLGVYYKNGLHVDQDDDKAFKYISISAEDGCALSYYLLGECYYNGIGVEANTILAKDYYEKAAAEGIKEAVDALKKII